MRESIVQEVLTMNYEWLSHFVDIKQRHNQEMDWLVDVQSDKTRIKKTTTAAHYH